MKKLLKKDTCMKFYNVRNPLYLEKDISGIVLGVIQLQVKDGLNCGRSEIPNNKILWLIELANKSPTSVQKCFSRIARKALLFYRRSKHLN